MPDFPFDKMHGLGNCFVLMDDRGDRVSGAVDPVALARAVCDRNTGIGADGLLLARDAAGGGLAMRILNEDGSEAEMCGNGIRCFARFALDRGLTGERGLTVETLAGPIRTRILGDGQVEVDMGEPSSAAPVAPEGRAFSRVSMGNPHAIAFVDGFDFDWRAEGARVERALVFPEGTNVHFARAVSPTEAEVKVWERGCGETMACGTGACAVAVAGVLDGRLEREPVTVRLPGGPLRIHWNERNRVMMTGPAVLVCRGTYFFQG
jgi:diaminopimelate epimerase